MHSYVGTEVFGLWKWLGASVNASIMIVLCVYMTCSIFREQSCSMELGEWMYVCMYVCNRISSQILNEVIKLLVTVLCWHLYK